MTEDSSASPPVRRPFWFRRRFVPVPTWKTWLVILTLVAMLAWWFVSSVHGWLAAVKPVERAPYMIVEGWAPDYVLEEAMAAARDGEVKRIFTTGVPLDRGTFLTEYRNYAELCAASLAKMGIEPQRLCPVPASAAKTDRTRTMARALKAVLDGENIPAAEKRINLYTLGTHGRRSWRIFKEVLGSDWQVGVISVPSEDYDASRWYRQSGGAKTVLDELVALAVQSTGGE
jgi:hypothetical protein